MSVTETVKLSVRTIENGAQLIASAFSDFAPINHIDELLPWNFNKNRFKEAA